MKFFTNRRNKVFDTQLTKMARSEVLEAVIQNLYFEAACRYAQDNGGKLYPDTRDSIIFDKVIDGENYSVFFTVGRGGNGLHIKMTLRRPVTEMASEAADAFVRRAVGGNGQQLAEPLLAIREVAIRSLTTTKVVRFRPMTEKTMREFFAHHATSIPIKSETNSLGSSRIGLLDLPGHGVLIVFAAVLEDEAVIKVLGELPTPLGISQTETLSTKREGLIEFLDETFPTLCLAIDDEIKIRQSEKS
ncbi:hypothetical protein ASD74_23920 [Rhizobium sp. Root564]|nr:hypothetical protein ASD74_23920 [Rhizobium sp. Root564]